MDRGICQATVHGVTKNQTRLSNQTTKQRTYCIIWGMLLNTLMAYMGKESKKRVDIYVCITESRYTDSVY